MARHAKKSKQIETYSGGWAMVPRVFFDTNEYRALSTGARSLLLQYGLRYTGKNNGNLEMTEAQFAEAGLGSPTTFRKYNTELINAGWIVVTRQGGMRQCSLYALTYFSIDDTGIQYDHPRKAASMPLHLWKTENEDQRDVRQKVKVRDRLEQLVERRRNVPPIGPQPN